MKNKNKIVSQEDDKPFPPYVPEPVKVIRLVHFVVDAVVNFNYVKQVSCETHDISLVEDLVFFQDKNSKVQYMVPLSNVRTVVFQ
jgi:hypothetical protein